MIRLCLSIFLLAVISNCAEKDYYDYYNYDENYGYIESGNYNYGLDGDAPKYQCELTSTDLKSGNQSLCSGTYLSANVFMTAAHCVDIRDNGRVNKSARSYEVKCYEKSSRSVKAIALHPYNQTNNFYFEDVSEPNQLNPEKIAFFSDYNDIALLYTESIDFEEYPELPTEEFHKVSNYRSGSCRMLGYSPSHCNSSNGYGCYREGFSSSSYDRQDLLIENKDEQCELSTGKNCYLSKLFKDSATEENPLLLSVGQLVSGQESIGSGDSGSGLLCKDALNKDIVVGVLSYIDDSSLDSRYIFVHTKNKLNFIQELLDINETEFIAKTKAFSLHPEYVERLDVAEQIKNLIESSRIEVNVSHVFIDEYSELLAKEFLLYATRNKSSVIRRLSRETNVVLIFSELSSLERLILDPIQIDQTDKVTYIEITTSSSDELNKIFL